MSDRTQRQSQEQVPWTDRVLNQGDANFTMTILNRVVRFTGVSSARTCTLPPVEEAAGLIFVIIAVVDGTSLTITDGGDDALHSDQVTNADNEYSILYSDGFHWYVLSTNI